MSVTQLNKHILIYNEEFHTDLQRIYETFLMLMFSDITFSSRLYLSIHKCVQFAVR